MQNRMLTGLAFTVLLTACGPDAAQQPAQEQAAADAPDLFVAEPTATAQVVFVGADSTIRPPAWRDAVFVPLSTFSEERDGIPNEFPPAATMAALLRAAGVRGDSVIFVGEPIPAGRAWAAFDYLGLGDRAALLDGGPAALAAEPANGGGARDDGRGQLDIAVRADMIVDAQWVHDRLDDPGTVIIDARPPAEYSGETPGDGIERPGHIPGARNVFWQTLVHSAGNPRLRDEAELRRIFEQAGVGPDDTIVAYCRTGGQSSFLYTVARHLGYRVRLYDGSFIDWSRTDYPVER
jgi:thiosulfate/3-mercaptopyruvate sulfurtransferase